MADGNTKNLKKEQSLGLRPLLVYVCMQVCVHGSACVCMIVCVLAGSHAVVCNRTEVSLVPSPSSLSCYVLSSALDAKHT